MPPLTDKQIKAIKPENKPLHLFDGGGMFLLVTPKGQKWWRLKYRHQGKSKLLSLGVYPHVSLKEARAERERLKAMLSKGIDPGYERKEVKTETTASVMTLEFVAREWYSKNAKRWSPNHAARVIDSLEKNIFPALGASPVHELTPLQLLVALRKMEDREAYELTHRLLQRLNAILRYAVINAYTPTNPAETLKGALSPIPRVNHRAAMQATELPAFFEKLKSYGGDRQTAIGLNLILLTATRTGEMRFAKWDEFHHLNDPARAEWRIPAERMKMREAHIIPLPRQALPLLDELKAINAGYAYLFPGPSGKKPVSENCWLFALYRMGYHSRATTHGFRALFSTTMNEQGFHPDHIERQLAHAPRNKVRAAYNRATYLKERRALLQAWSDYLDTLKSGVSTREETENIML